MNDARNGLLAGAASAQSDLAEALAGIGELTGVSPSAGRLWSLLWFSDRPLSLDELASTAGVAKSGASMALRSLVQAGLARRLPTGLDRRSYYVVVASPWTIVKHWVDASFIPEVEAMGAAASAGAAHAVEVDSDVLQRRFADWQDFLGEMRAALDNLSRRAAERAAATE